MWKMNARGRWGPDTVSNEKIYVSADQVQKNTEPLFAQRSQIINYFWSELEPNVLVRSQVFGAFSVCSWSIIKSLCFLHQFPTSLKMSLKMPLPFSNWSERQVWCSWNRINLELLWEIFDKISRIPLLQYNYSHFHKWTRLLPNAHLIKTKCTINSRYMENGRQNNSKLWCQEIQIHTALTTEKKYVSWYVSMLWLWLTEVPFRCPSRGGGTQGSLVVPQRPSNLGTFLRNCSPTPPLSKD